MSSELSGLLLSEGNGRLNKDGIHWLVAACFVVGTTAGTGFLSLPFAVEMTGAAGFVLLPVIWALSLYTGKCISDSMEQVTDCKSYSELAAKSSNGSVYTKLIALLYVDLFYVGSSVVCLLLAAENANYLDVGIASCEWILIFGGITGVLVNICRDMKTWWFQILTYISSALALIAAVMLFAIIINPPKDTKEVAHTDFNWKKLSSAIGIMVFACGGHSAYPTIQYAMEKRERFSWSLCLGFVVLLIVYIPCMIASYIVLGNQTPRNVLDLIDKDNPAYKAVLVLMTVHLLLSISIMMHPLCEEIEEVCGVKREVCSVRTNICRSTLMVIVVLIALLVPHFDILLSLIGSAIVTCLTFVFPSLIQLKLCRDYDRSPYWRWFNNGVLTLGVMLSLALTIGTSIYVHEDKGKRFIQSCFVNFTEQF